MKKVLTAILCFVFCMTALITAIALDPEGDDQTSLRESFTLQNMAADESLPHLGQQIYPTTLPTYFLDFGNSKISDELSKKNMVKGVYDPQGYTTFQATGEDPYFFIKSIPTTDSSHMKYTYLLYKTEVEGAHAEIYVNRSDGSVMGQSEGTQVHFPLEKAEEWTSTVIDTSGITQEGVTFTAYRLDPLADVAGGATDKAISFQCLATFATEEEAKNFNYAVYKQYLSDKQLAQANAEQEMTAALWNQVTPTEKRSSAADNVKGSLEYTVSEDKKTVTISYLLNGERVSHTVPNHANYTSGGFGATDDLDRTLPTSLSTGIYGDNGEYYVGIFYFLWLGEHGDTGVWDNSKILEQYSDAATNPERWGPEGQMHFFAEPLYGYYYSSDEWVIRKHMELLSNANIDFLYFDVTNGYAYVDNAKKVMKVCHELNEAGYDAPQVVFYTHTSDNAVVQTLYEEIYSQNLYPDTWFTVEAKPVIVASESANINDFFSIRNSQWPNEGSKDNSWPWMDFNYPQRIFEDNTGKFGNAISVSIAQHSGSLRFSSSALYGDLRNRGRTCVGISDKDSEYELTAYSYQEGNNFQTQWEHVFHNKEQIKYVLVTGWNEWVAQRQPTYRKEPICFVDTITPEYSRDAEMTRGYYFDNYYMQLISNIQALKGSAPIIVQDAKNPINITGDFDQWDTVLITYKDAAGDNANRNNACFGNSSYTDNSGNHDILASKVTQDTKNIYFYVSTAKNLKLPDGNSSWMQLFLNTDQNAKTGWYGYDYIVNYTVDAAALKSAVAKCISTDGSYEFEKIGEVDFKVDGNEMMIEIPLKMLGIKKCNEIYMEFKWADADEGIRYQTMEDFYCFGDAAPLGRLNYIYQNYIPGVSIVKDTEISTIHKIAIIGAALTLLAVGAGIFAISKKHRLHRH